MENNKINIRNMYIELLNKLKTVEGVDIHYIDQMVQLLEHDIDLIEIPVNWILSVIPSGTTTEDPLVKSSQVPAAQVNSDWNANSGVAQILNKPTIPAAQVNSDWNADSGAAQILNKPTIPAAQVNSDWNANSGVAQILNKPSELNTRVMVVDHRFWELDSTLSLYKYRISDISGVYDTSKASDLSLASYNALRATASEEAAYDTVVGYDIIQDSTTFDLIIYSVTDPDYDFYVKFNYWK